MAGTTASLNLSSNEVDTSWDSVVIVCNLETIPGGKTLDVETVVFAPEYIRAGHIIIEETATGILRPMPVTGSAYAALPAGHTYKGVLVATILKAQPFAAIMLRGSVNQQAFVNGGGYSGVPAAALAITGIPLIRFTKD